MPWSSRKARREAEHKAQIDPWGYPEPWRGFLTRLIDAGERFDSALGSWPDGPTRDRLSEISPRLHAQMDGIVPAIERAATLTSRSPGLPAAPGPTAAQLSASIRRLQADRARLAPNDAAALAALDRAEASAAASLRAAREAEAVSQRLVDAVRSAVELVEQAAGEVVALAVESSLGETLSSQLAGNLDEVCDEIASLSTALESAGPTVVRPTS